MTSQKPSVFSDTDALKVFARKASLGLMLAGMALVKIGQKIGRKAW